MIPTIKGRDRTLFFSLRFVVIVLMVVVGIFTQIFLSTYFANALTTVFAIAVAIIFKIIGYEFIAFCMGQKAIPLEDELE